MKKILLIILSITLVMNKSQAQKTKEDKIAIYQLFTRIFANQNTTNKFNGTKEENGVTKFNDINNAALKSIKSLGITHVWYTGVIEHATMTDYSAFGIKKDHPETVKGIAGSPYAIKDYYDVNPDYAVNVENRMAEFEALLERTHKQKMKVLIDFIPNHVAREYNSDAKPKGVKDFGAKDQKDGSFQNQNNFYYIANSSFKIPEGVKVPVSFEGEYIETPAKATGNDVFNANPSINDWFETIKLNYGVDYLNGKNKVFEPLPDTWKKMTDILLFWSAKGVDGFRCDMAEMVPVEFWAYAIPKVKAKYPEVIFIAEVYNPAEYRNYIFNGKFDYLYDKVGLYDALRRLIEGHGNAMDISRVWQNESGEFSNHMLRFLENHDEQRIASEPFGKTPESAFAAMMLSATLHTGPIMVYYGQELGVKPVMAEGFQGNDGRTTIFDYWGLPELQNWIKDGEFDIKNLSPEELKIRSFYEATLKFAQKQEAIKNGGFHDLQYLNFESQGYDTTKCYSYLRFSGKEVLLFVYNFDLQNNTFLKVKLPESVLNETLNKKSDKVLNAEEAFEGNEKFKISVSAIVNEGLPLEVNPNSFRIFRIK
jgi:glycosidase